MLPTHEYVQLKYHLVGVLQGDVRAWVIRSDETCGQLGWVPAWRGEEERWPPGCWSERARSRLLVGVCLGYSLRSGQIISLGCRQKGGIMQGNEAHTNF